LTSLATIDDLYKKLNKETLKLNLKEFACRTDAQKELELFKKIMIILLFIELSSSWKN
jgi:hypothetical protein